MNGPKPKMEKMKKRIHRTKKSQRRVSLTSKALLRIQLNYCTRIRIIPANLVHGNFDDGSFVLVRRLLAISLPAPTGEYSCVHGFRSIFGACVLVFVISGIAFSTTVLCPVVLSGYFLLSLLFCGSRGVLFNVYQSMYFPVIVVRSIQW